MTIVSWPRAFGGFVVAAAVCLLSGQPLAAQTAPLDSSWKQFLQERIGASSAGYAWVVLRRGKLAAGGGNGVTSIDSAGRRGAAMLPTTRMQIASATKPITAMAVLLALHERGISIDTPMVALLRHLAPARGRDVERVTVRQLLQHRSGYPFGYLWPPRLDSTRALLARPVPNPPGDGFRYSNINYSLARTILEHESGASYEDFIQQRFLRPSGITQASLVNAHGDAFAHQATDPIRGRELVWDFRDDAGGYGWYMTATDLANWGWALLSGKLVPAPVLEDALAAGLGWNRVVRSGVTAFVHDGQWVAQQRSAVRTGIALLPDSTVAVLFLNTNVSLSPSRLLVDAFANANAKATPVDTSRR